MKFSKIQSMINTTTAMIKEAVKTITALLVNSFLVGQVVL